MMLMLLPSSSTPKRIKESEERKKQSKLWASSFHAAWATAHPNPPSQREHSPTQHRHNKAAGLLCCSCFPSGTPSSIRSIRGHPQLLHAGKLLAKRPRRPVP